VESPIFCKQGRGGREDSRALVLWEGESCSDGISSSDREDIRCMNAALLYFTLHLVEVQIDRQLDSPYVVACATACDAKRSLDRFENCVQVEREFICMKDYLDG